MLVDALTWRALRLAAGLPAAAHVFPSAAADLHKFQLKLIKCSRIEAGYAYFDHRKHAPTRLGHNHFVRHTGELLPELLFEQFNAHRVHFVDPKELVISLNGLKFKL